jgi:hypothetical protein
MTDRASRNMDKVMEQPPLLFISHLHEDRPVADVIASFVQTRSAGRVEVFQSSSAEVTGPRPGERLAQELREQLWRASVVLLIYSYPSRDWSWPMWECGVAEQPQSPSSRIVIFQLTDAFPQVYVDRTRVRMGDLTEIRRFTHDLLTSPQFFPRYGQAVTGFQPGSREVDRAASELYEELRPVLPIRDGDEITTDEWPPYPFLNLELGAENVLRINEQPDDPQRLQATMDAVKESPVVAADREAMRIFGMARMTPDIRFGTWVETWKNENPDVEAKWFYALCSQIMAAVVGRYPTLIWEVMRGLDRNDGTWYAPVVNRVRTSTGSRSIEFDVYFDKFEFDDERKCVKVGTPF